MRKLFTSESVTKGHPDKIADQISDAVLDDLLKNDRYAKCACEVIVEPGHVHIMGEITSTHSPNYIEIARDVIKSIGYTKDEYGFSDKANITCSVHTQSPDIAMGVNQEEMGAGDQGIMFGYAVNETEELMPLSLTLARKLTNKLTEVREDNTLSYLRPDGKAQVTVVYEDNKITSVDTVVLSTQHNEGIELERLREDVKREIIEKVIPKELLTNETKYFINPTGRFVLGGPAADTGLTGRKIIVDTYGGAAHHGGGAFSGKDGSKVDRSASYAARNIAKTIVKAGIANKCEIQLSYAIGIANPISIFVEVDKNSKLSSDELTSWIYENFDLRPRAIIEKYKINTPIFSATAEKGHFGYDYLPWEIVDEELILSLKTLSK